MTGDWQVGIAYRIDLDIFCIFVIILIWVSRFRPSERRFLEYRLFMMLLDAAALLLISDALNWYYDGRPGSATELVIANVVYFSIHTIVPYVWLLYADLRIFHDEERTIRLSLPLSPLAIVCTVVALTTPLTGALFSVDAAGVFHRGPWITPLVLSNYAYLLIALALTVLNRRRIERRALLALLVFPLPPMIGGVLQTVFYGISLIWPGATLSLLTIYINAQNTKLNTDYLTGSYNRMQADLYLKQRVAHAATRGAFSGILIDIDNFKEINDHHGHPAGDAALQTVATLLRRAVRKDDFVARFGGDEFIILLEIPTQADLERSVERIRAAVRAHNDANRQTPERLGLSFGYDVYDPATGMTDGEFLRHIDSLMYKSKPTSRLARTREVAE